MTEFLRIATRKSPLALQQTEIFAHQLKKKWPKLQIELVPMSTQGDELLDRSLQTLGGKGLFIKELEKALLEGRADIAVHSMKDVPAQLPDELTLACICKRDNPFDALVSPKNHGLLDLKTGSLIGTASLRRQAQLLAFRPDLHVKILRGNINTRLEKLQQGQYDAIILACAGLERMNLHHYIHQQLSADIMLPACGQGAIGIECRTNDKKTQQLLHPLNHNETALCVNIEREINARLGGHCHVPIAIFAQLIDDSIIELNARVFNSVGTKKISFHQRTSVDSAMEIARTCAQELLDKGAEELIKSL